MKTVLFITILSLLLSSDDSLPLDMTSEGDALAATMADVQAPSEDSLPLITITTQTPLNAREKVGAMMKTVGYEGAIGIKLRGNSSLSFNQKKYTFETRNENGKDSVVSLLGLPAHSKWVLLAPYNDVSMMRDPLAFQLWRDMGIGGRVP